MHKIRSERFLIMNGYFSVLLGLVLTIIQTVVVWGLFGLVWSIAIVLASLVFAMLGFLSQTGIKNPKTWDEESISYGLFVSAGVSFLPIGLLMLVMCVISIISAYFENRAERIQHP